jgi:hypothetical protein
MGMAWGAAESYLSIYLSEELHADYSLIGEPSLRFICTSDFKLHFCVFCGHTLAAEIKGNN